MITKAIRQLFVCGSVLTVGLTFLEFQKEVGTSLFSLPGQLASNTYFGPVTPAPGNPQLVRIELMVRDSPDASGLQIVSVQFDHTSVPLKPRDIYGNRGNASFQVKPGKYQLIWTVNRDKFAWPRTVTHEEVVTVNPRDLWLQISIVGETASIN